MAKPPIYSFNLWPMEMRAETATAYVDEPSVAAFWAKVRRGIHPQPLRQKGCLPKWHREIMDYHVALRHELHCEFPGAAENVEHLI